MLSPLPLRLAAFTLALALASGAFAQERLRADRAEPPAAAGSTAWGKLSRNQQAALAPLQSLWPTLGADPQRKWLALAQDFGRMPPAEQVTLQRRMADWAALTPEQRARVRLNFGEAKALSPDERRSKWEQYQALPQEQREQLVRERPTPPVTTAPALRPAPATRPARAQTSPTSRNPGANPVTPPNRQTLQPHRSGSSEAGSR